MRNLITLLAWAKRKWYVCKMMKAIERACSIDTGEGKRLPRTIGLRTIRDFERVNGIPFDPSNEAHISSISGMALFKHFNMKMDKMMKEWRNEL